MSDKFTKAASQFVSFVNSSPSAFHAVHTAKCTLLNSGFVELCENKPWKLKKGGKYFYTRNQSTLVAFAVGGKFKPGNGFSVVGAHTDSPCFKVKPNSAKTGTGDFLQVGVQTYGGGLWHTWFDRDLTVAGRVLVRGFDDGKEVYVSKLVHIERPILYIPSLAIHLDRSIREKGFNPNLESHAEPILATKIKDSLDGADSADDSSSSQHHSALLNLLAEKAECEVKNIVNFELSVCGTQPATVGGAHNEFIFSPRLDNLCSSYTGLQALCDAGKLDEDCNVRALLLFDNEEVGSASAYGAACPILNELIERVTSNNSLSESNEVDASSLVHRAVRNSFLVSADMAHSVHPNYAEKHEANHRPQMHKGPVIKHNANQRYATTNITAAVLLELAKRNDIPMQEFVVRNDSACGSTIGPIISANTGVRTVDIGIAQLAMHSIREMCGTDDVHHGIRLFQVFYEDFAELDSSINAGDGAAASTADQSKRLATSSSSAVPSFTERNNQKKSVTSPIGSRMNLSGGGTTRPQVFSRR